VRFLFVLALVFLALAGCDARIERFEPNQVYAMTLARSRSTPCDAALRDASVAVDELFGSPDEPRWPDVFAEAMPQVDADRLVRAAGPVSSGKDGTHQGLFREHCVTCHGLPGSGAGPASLFQNPYPRDFRHGVFKWKSTDRSSKPLRDDLLQLLKHGVPGTAMPSFALQSSEDLETLADYVIYLSVRGEVERRMLTAAIDELDYGEEPPEDSLRLNCAAETEGSQVVDEILLDVANSWGETQGRAVSVPAWAPLAGQALQGSVQRGKDIFHGPIANCVGCHGPAGNGNAVTLDFDDWTKEFSTRIGLTPSDREAMRPFRKAGALTPRVVKPRNLQDGVFRGGGDPQTLYRRISQGIAGTPMPAVEVVAEENGKGLTEDQMWDLVRYIQSLANGS
jgi:mono/diheme cytochrome c family protein